MSEKLYRKCVICGKMFETVYPSKITCSLECSAQRKSDTARAYQQRCREERHMPKKTCRVCGKEFVPEEGTKNQSYCSIECKRLEHNRRARDRYHEMRYIEPQAATMAAAILPDEPTLDEKIAAAQEMGMTYGQYILMLRQRKGEI